MVRNIQKKPAHLPERLTISFPIWGLYATEETDVYADCDKMMREHVERGFNCIRLDDGAGLMHDLDGNPLPPVKIKRAFDQYATRQACNAFTPGYCDVRKRLIDLFTAAKKYNVYIILSSWFYLHTYWMVDDKDITDYFIYMEPHKRYEAFGKYLHYIICELEERGLDSQIAFAEIFNEANGLTFSGGYENMYKCPVEERVRFRQEHTEAIEFLKKEHPQILFAYDVSWPTVEEDLAPRNVDVYNAHQYFMWALYNVLDEEPDRWLLPNRVSKEEVLSHTYYPELVTDDWVQHLWFYGNLDKSKISEIEELLAITFDEKEDFFYEKLHRNIERLQADINEVYPDTLLACGEGVSYNPSNEVLFEEKSEKYWKLMMYMAAKFREIGLWGTIVRTCCGPEDPVWNMCPDKIREFNHLFLYGDK
ncbi:MAG: hypothetical protein IJB84_01275 [Lachnospiraceae bacterium]|nr:hypothetical protein [Lachnospiraceae bacterium]